jgi:hypothetical protein
MTKSARQNGFFFFQEIKKKKERKKERKKEGSKKGAPKWKI